MVYVGTSGYSYKQWKGPFYPEDLPAAEMLTYYGRQFPTVEVNNTFHRMPKMSIVQAWGNQVPASFRFAIKAPQRITHFQRLKGAEDSVAYLIDVVRVLQTKLGPLLFQLPPNLKKDVPRLSAFLKLLPASCRAAFEFRHDSWFDDEVYGLLRESDAAMCLAEAEGELEVPFVATANWGYLRLRLPDYTDAQLKAKARRVLEQSWKEAFVFFKHEDEARGPKLASAFAKFAEGLLGRKK